MGENSNIEWTHHTLNLWVGCHKVAPECEHCYASMSTTARVDRAHGSELWGKDANRHITTPGTINKVFRWNKDAAAAGERRRVFVNSLSDVLEDRRDLDERRGWLWEVVEQCQALDFLLLSKRPGNFATLTPARWRGGWPRNLWAGTSAGTNRSANKFIRALRRSAAPAAVRFVSGEPLLEDVDYTPDLIRGIVDGESNIDWIILGGESHQPTMPARSCNLRHLWRAIEDARGCQIPTFVKQLGDNVVAPNDFLDDEDFDAGDVPIADDYEPTHQGEVAPLVFKADKAGDPAEWPTWARVREMPELRP